MRVQDSGFRVEGLDLDDAEVSVHEARGVAGREEPVP